MKCDQKLKYFDQYGYRVSLNFKKQREIVKTNIGGIFSILSGLMILAYVIQKLNVMFLLQSTVSSQESIMSADQISSLYNINFTDTNILLYYRVVGAKFSDLGSPQPFDENLFFKYLNGYNMQVNMNYDNKTGKIKKQFVQETKRIFRKCQKSDFENIGALQYYDNKQNDTLICASHDNITLNSTNDDTVNSVFNYFITTCNNSFNQEVAQLNSSCENEINIQDYLRNNMIEMRIIFQQIDFSVFNRLPLQTRDMFLSYVKIDLNFSQIIEIPIRKNVVMLSDSFIYLGLNQDQYFTFYDIDYKSLNKFNLDATKSNYGSIVFVNKLKLSSQMVSHTRRLYGFFDILGELAGVTTVISAIFNFLLSPISQFTFYYQAIQKLFKFKLKHINPILKKSKSQNIFLKNIQKYSSKLSLLEVSSIKQNIIIRFTFSQKLYIYFIQLFGFCKLCFNKRQKIYEIYEKGYENLQKELDISKILRNIRNLKIHSKMVGLNGAEKFRIKNQDKNIIELSQSDAEISNYRIDQSFSKINLEVTNQEIEKSQQKTINFEENETKGQIFYQQNTIQSKINFVVNQNNQSFNHSKQKKSSQIKDYNLNEFINQQNIDNVQNFNMKNKKQQEFQQIHPQKDFMQKTENEINIMQQQDVLNFKQLNKKNFPG